MIKSKILVAKDQLKMFRPAKKSLRCGDGGTCTCGGTCGCGGGGNN